MKNTIDIDFLKLSSAYLLLLIPLIIFYFYKIRLIKDTVIATFRMTIQLFLIGIYLELIFDQNNPIINYSWIALMIFTATFTIIKKSRLKLKHFSIPIIFSLLVSVLFIDFYLFGFVIDIENFYDARYLIPISGMILGNALKANILALDSFYHNLKNNKSLYRFALSNGATRKEALIPFYGFAFRTALSPVIASIAIIGVISLPGMMTGQILGGSSPSVAIKYQLLIMITIFTSSLLSVLISIFLSNIFVFDKNDNLKNCFSND